MARLFPHAKDVFDRYPALTASVEQVVYHSACDDVELRALFEDLVRADFLVPHAKTLVIFVAFAIGLSWVTILVALTVLRPLGSILRLPWRNVRLLGRGRQR